MKRERIVFSPLASVVLVLLMVLKQTNIFFIHYCGYEHLFSVDAIVGSMPVSPYPKLLLNVTVVVVGCLAKS